MKIAIITPFQLRLHRGVEGVAWNLAVNLVENENISVDLFTWQHPEPIQWGEMPHRLKFHCVPYTRYFAKWLAIPFYTFWMLREHYDWILITFAGYGEAESLTLLRLIRFQRYGIVFHFPYSQVPHRYDEFRRFGIIGNASCVSAVSNTVAKEVETQYKRSCFVINNGIDPYRYHENKEMRIATREKYQISDDAPIIITLAAFEERKGIQWVLRALPYLLVDYPKLNYWVLGEGAFRIQLEREIQQLGLQRHVRLFGSVDDVVPLLQAADVACLLSSGEAFPLALVEYMATQLPVVTSKSAPFPDLIKPSWGVMVDEQKSQIVADVIRQLLSDDIRRHEMGLEGRTEVLKHYTWASIADEYLEMLNRSVQ